MAGHQHQVAFLGDRDQLGRLVGGARQRLLDQHVLAGFQGAADEREVGVGRGRDRDRLDPRVGQRGVEVALDPDAGVAAAEVVDPASSSSQRPISRNSGRSTTLRTMFGPQ